MNTSEPPIRVLFVCMGNICRSPTADAVFRARVQAAGLADRIEVDSAGTHGFHVGDPPDRRATEAAAARGYELGGLRARRVTPEDLEAFDYVLAMDEANLDGLRTLCTGPCRARVGLFLDDVPDTRMREVPDPYYGVRDGFGEVLDLVETGSEHLLARIRREHGL